MATITDLTGSEVSQVDETSVQMGEDSNVNTCEFGNLLPAGILPTLSSWLKSITDWSGSSGTISDNSGSSLSLSDSEGTSGSVVDISGS